MTKQGKRKKRKARKKIVLGEGIPLFFNSDLSVTGTIVGIMQFVETRKGMTTYCPIAFKNFQEVNGKKVRLIAEILQ